MQLCFTVFPKNSTISLHPGLPGNTETNDKAHAPQKGCTVMDKKQMTEKKGYSPAENLDDGWDDLEIEDLEIEDLDGDSDGNEVDVEEAGMDTEETGDDYVEYDDEDEENEDEEENDSDAEDALGRKEKRLRVSIHLVLGILILGILGLCFYKYKTFGNRITQEDIDAIPTPENPEIETYDYFTANPMQNDGTFPEDDGITTVVCFGNAPFADDKDSDSSVCSLFAKDSRAVVYNYAIADSLLAAHENPFTTDHPMDAFSFSYLISSLVSGDKTRLEEAYASMENVPAGLQSSMDELFSLDFRTVDMVYIMYDGSDYLENSMIYHDQIPDEPRYIAGSLTAGITALRNAYPWVDIVVMSPTFAYAVDENGKYVSSDMQKNEWNVGLSLYFMKEYETAFDNRVSFVDNFYGAIHEDIASDYLTDNLHLNEEGRKLIAKRMYDSLTAVQNLQKQ